MGERVDGLPVISELRDVRPAWETGAAGFN